MRCLKCKMRRPYSWMGGQHKCLVEGEQLQLFSNLANAWAPSFAMVLTEENIDWLTK